MLSSLMLIELKFNIHVMLAQQKCAVLRGLLASLMQCVFQCLRCFQV